MKKIIIILGITSIIFGALYLNGKLDLVSKLKTEIKKKILGQIIQKAQRKYQI